MEVLEKKITGVKQENLAELIELFKELEKKMDNKMNRGTFEAFAHENLGAERLGGPPDCHESGNDEVFCKWCCYQDSC